jgi:spore coat polysaccharide biosynthesis protein SpsF
MEKALAIVQARMSSTRLPGKSLADVHGESVLALLVRRLARARTLDRVVVATSTDDDDDAIAAAAEALEVGCHRGPRDDVLARFAGAASGHRGPIVRITADCPLIDPVLADAVVDLFAATPRCEYASNIEPRTYPDGLDVEVLSPALLRRLVVETQDPYDREHVTTLVRRRGGDVVSAFLVGDEPLGALRWTVDTQEDLDFVRAVVERLGSRRHEAGFVEILDAVRGKPSLATFQGLRG